jgi:8-oxo-dGTP diphosphatase
MTERQSFYIGIKGLIQNEAGHVLILKDVGSGKWEVPGGRLDQGQSIEEAFRREIEDEELPGSILRSLGSVAHTAQGDFIVENNHKLFLVFHLADVALPEVIILSDEHSDSAWIDPSDTSAFDLYSTDRTAIETLAA